MTPNPFVTVAEAATILGRSERRVRELIKAGVLRCVPVSPRRRFLYRAECIDYTTRRDEDE